MLAEQEGTLVVAVVDDDEFTRRALRNLLKTYDCRVVEASSGLEALRLVSSYLPSLMLLDVRMPVISGLEVLKEIRASASFRDLPVVAMSGDADKDLVLQLIQLGITGFLVKPLFREEVTRRLDPVFAALLRGEATTFSRPMSVLGERPGLLIADADNNFRGFVRPLVEARFEVFEASTGVAAHDLIQQRRPAWALLGEGLPMLGAESIARLLKEDGTTSTKLIFASAASAVSDENRRKFEAVIRRSFIPDAFLDELRRVGIFRDAASLELAELVAGELRVSIISAIQQSVGVLAGREARLAPESARAAVKRQVSAKVALASPTDESSIMLSLSCSNASAEVLGSQILGMPTSLDEGSLDAMGEIINTIGGRLRESLANRGIRLDLLFPETGPVPDLPPSRAALSLAFVTDEGESFDVDVTVDE